MEASTGSGALKDSTYRMGRIGRWDRPALGLLQIPGGNLLRIAALICPQKGLVCEQVGYNATLN